MLVINKVFDFGKLHALAHPGGNILTDDGVAQEAGFHIRHKALFQMQQVKHITYLHEHIEFILGHDFAELAIPQAVLQRLVIPRLVNGAQFCRRHVADVGLVGRIVERVAIGTNVLRELEKILGFGVHDAFGCLGRSVVDNHIRRVGQDITGPLDHTVHSFCTIHLKNYRYLSILMKRGAHHTIHV
ncbi:hypothetical protein SDC9_193092 [bioreactor metagenome]|uniref:Uncharacterized protein n=1 Tax=bioreactor metagenome TaxID=1076179 RepID=A0A645I2L2_9ZZZZ